MQERKEQDLAAKDPDPQDNSFHLWAASLNGALEEPVGANGHNGGAPEGQTNVQSPEGPTSRKSRLDNTPIDDKDPDDWLVAVRRRVRIENERRLLEREAVSHALEEFGRVHAPVEARWSAPTRVRRLDKYETLLLRPAEREALPET